MPVTLTLHFCTHRDELEETDSIEDEKASYNQHIALSVTILPIQRDLGAGPGNVKGENEGVLITHYVYIKM